MKKGIFGFHRKHRKLRFFALVAFKKIVHVFTENLNKFSIPFYNKYDVIYFPDFMSFHKENSGRP